ncbi:MFS transporter, partial [Aeromicrobium sp. REDSEA-S32_B7]|uniref:MFS transporter n=1 Tax=Aeromicrobium sp. REDSEA-S32_B7 TaxID=1811526 RepID=UPI00295341E4
MSEEPVDTHEDRPTTSDEPNPARWQILAVTLVVGFMSLLDVTIVNVAIPSMQAGLDTSAAAVQWVVSGYALSFGLVLVIGGRLGDAFGRRRLMLLGLTGFVVASALVGLAPGTELVVAARLLQGISAGLLTPQNSGLIQTLFRGAERGRAFGLFGFVVSISSALGPVLGGLIITLAGSEDGWRWIFWVNVPVGLVALVLVARIVPSEVSSEGDDPRLDLVGALLLGLTVLCVIYPLVSLEGGGYRWLVLLAAVPVGLLLISLWSRAKPPGEDRAEVLEHTLGGKDIAEVHEMSVAEAHEHFSSGEAKLPAAVKILDRLADVGLGYLTLGQALT